MIARPTNVFDPDYYRLLTIWDGQQRAAADNALVRLNWPGIVKNWIAKAQQDLAAGKTADPPPAMPLMVVVADDGTNSRVPFLDLMPAVLPVVAVTPSTGGFIFGGAPGSAVAPDRTDQILAMLRAIAAKLGIAGA